MHTAVHDGGPRDRVGAMARRDPDACNEREDEDDAEEESLRTSMAAPAAAWHRTNLRTGA